MAEARNDLLMCLFAGHTALPAESTSVITTGDTLLSDFAQGSFFEVESFTIGFKLDDKDKTGAASPTGRSYEAWRAVTSAGSGAGAIVGGQLFYAKPEELQIVRDLDTASPTLMQYCLSGDTLTKAVMVKRGRDAAGNLTGFAKWEFGALRVRSVDWSDGDTVRETCKFKFGSLAYTYNIRAQDGTFVSSVDASWSPPSDG